MACYLAVQSKVWRAQKLSGVRQQKDMTYDKGNGMICLLQCGHISKQEPQYEQDNTNLKLHA